MTRDERRELAEQLHAAVAILDKLLDKIINVEPPKKPKGKKSK
jgi:hypothetical protein